MDTSEMISVSIVFNFYKCNSISICQHIKYIKNFEWYSQKFGYKPSKSPQMNIKKSC